MKLGVCYYPEHWPEDRWATDARMMREAGLSLVRIGEFAWSRLEPEPDSLAFEWLDRAFETLAAEGLEIVLGTPTATPPRWMLDRHPDMLAVDREGRMRRFGSRRHYCFSHLGYRAEAARIARLLGERYGRRAALAGWQIDNEYGCHDTTLSYSPSALRGFRAWLARRYGDSIDALNDAWGNVFWSMTYRSFDEIDLPNLTVTDANPAHELAFRRFTSDQVVAFNRAQVDALRPLTKAPLIHNYMGRILDFDHFDVGADLDVASWDSYPLGFLEDRVGASPERRAAYLRQGDPDFQAFHHDLYRAVGRGRWLVMEQQPGPVNWAPHNPIPAPGAVRMWTLEAFGHGAEAVCYFRWRQAPFAQEQMHAGLLAVDGRPAPALAEARRVADELATLEGVAERGRGHVALLIDYAAFWALDIERQSIDLDGFDIVFDAYRAFRAAGLDVDVLDARAVGDLTAWPLVAAPGLAIASPALEAALWQRDGVLLLGPRFGAKTDENALPSHRASDSAARFVRVERLETLPRGAHRALDGGGAAERLFEEVVLEEGATPVIVDATGAPVVSRAGDRFYVSAALDDAAYERVVGLATAAAGLDASPMPEGVRRSRRGRHDVLVNYAAEARALPPALARFGDRIGALDALIRPV